MFLILAILSAYWGWVALSGLATLVLFPVMLLIVYPFVRKD